MSAATSSSAPPERSAGVTVTVLPLTVRYSLRLRPANAATAGTALGLDLPRTIGRIATGGGRRALMLGPDEWQLDGPEGDAPALPADLPHALVRIGDREVTFRIEGPRAAELLSLGIARDLARIAPGTGCRTVFDGVQVVLVREGEAEFTLAAWRSFASHVADLLATGQREFASGL